MAHVTANFKIWFDDSDRLHIATNDAHFKDPEGKGGNGLHLVCHYTPLSADYNPKTYNRAVFAWQRMGWKAPIAATVRDRNIDRRIDVITSYFRDFLSALRSTDANAKIDDE
jgi:hypothetical protein